MALSHPETVDIDTINPVPPLIQHVEQSPQIITSKNNVYEHFHYLLSYQFRAVGRDDRHPVRTAYLDTYFNKFQNGYKSTHDTHKWPLRRNALRLYFNQKWRYDTRKDRHLTHIQDPEKRNALNRLLYDFKVYINTMGRDFFRYVDLENDTNVEIYYEQIMQRFHSLIDHIHRERIYEPITRTNIEPRQVALTKNMPVPIIHPWVERVPILTHRKGHRGFVKDFEYVHHW